MRRLLLLLGLLALPLAAQAEEATLRAPRGALDLALPNGTRLQGAALAGLTRDLGPAPREFRIAAAMPDPVARTGEVGPYGLRRGDEAGAWTIPAWQPSQDGTRAALFVETGDGGIE